MSKLRIFDNGQLVSEIALDINKEYIAGRSDNCDIKLRSEPGISRQHYKLIWSEGRGWVLHVLSQYGEVYVGQNQIQDLELNQKQIFSVPPYEFEFIQEDEVVPTASDQEGFDSERTVIVNKSEQAFLRVMNSSGQVLSFFKLEGEHWIAGRETNSTIFLDFDGISRRQFELMFKNGVYFCRDAGSSNGSTLNGSLLSGQWTPVRSGDVIGAAGISLVFELRDAGFEERISGLGDNRPLILYQPQIMQKSVDTTKPNQNYNPYAPAYDDLDNAVEPIMNKASQGQQKTFYIRLLIVVLVLGGAYFYTQQPTQEIHMASQQSEKKPAVSGFASLKPEEQQFVRTSYRLAKELFMQGRYEMARQEIIKIYQFVAEYEDSKELEDAATQAIQLQQDKAQLELAEKEKLESEQKILAQIADCKNKVNSKFSSAQLEQCLAPILALNPEHPSIISLRAEVEQLQAEQQMKAAEKAEYQALVRKRQILFDQALSKLNAGPSLEAKKAFEKVVTSLLPDPQNLKAEAQRRIASIEQSLNAKQQELERQAEQALRKGELKVAIQSLQKALEIDPANGAIENKLKSNKAELSKQMQTLYQEGILEESVGEVDTAKTKWKRILEKSVPDEEYYKKATIKLKKYGAY